MLPKWYSGPSFNSLHSPAKRCSGKEESVSQRDDHLYVRIKEVGYKFVGLSHACCSIHLEQGTTLIYEMEYPFQSILWTQATCIEPTGVWVHCIGPNST